MRDCHQLVGQAEVEVSLVEVAVPVGIGVIPCEVHLAPLTVDLHCVPGVPVARHARVGNSCGVEQLLVDALIGLAGAFSARETALCRAPVEVMVVF